MQTRLAPLAWYVAHTKPRQEETALANLERQGYCVYLPRLRVDRIRRRKVETVVEPMFPRYLFIRLDAGGGGKSWAPIRSTLGVSRLVHFGNTPARIDDEWIDLLRDRERLQETRPLFSDGEKVVIAEGPFAGIEAIYQTSDPERRAIILLEILSKRVTMRIDGACLRKTG